MRIGLAGATGLVGGQVLPLLGSHELVLLTRREIANAPAGALQLIGALHEWPRLLAGQTFDVAICCLGTTIKQAGSKDAFAAVDLEGVAGFAGAARMAGARQFMMISSVGADARASNFYLQTKGRAEALMQGLGFERVDIFRPGLLRGERGGPDRMGETLAMAISPFTDFLTPRALDKYRSIAAAQVASAISALVGSACDGVFVHHHREMMLTSSPKMI